MPTFADRIFLRLFKSLLLLFVAPCVYAQLPVSLPDAPSSLLVASLPPAEDSSLYYSSSLSSPASETFSFYPEGWQQTPAQTDTGRHQPEPGVELDVNGNPIPLERHQPKRILGFMPNYRTVSAGAVVHPPGWKYNFTVARRQALDYSSFIFLGITSLTAEGLDSHPVLGKGVGGF